MQNTSQRNQLSPSYNGVSANKIYLFSFTIYSISIQMYVSNNNQHELTAFVLSSMKTVLKILPEKALNGKLEQMLAPQR